MDKNLTPSCLQRGLPVFALLIYTIAATLGAFMGGVWAGFAIGLAALLFFATWRLEGKLPIPERHITVLAMAALIVIAALNLKSSDASLSWGRWERLVTIFLPLVLFATPAVAKYTLHPRFFLFVAIAAMIGALALSIELYLGCPLLQMMKGVGASPTQYNRGLSYLVLLAFPVMAGLWMMEKRWAAVIFMLIFLIPADLTESRASKLAMIIGLPMIIITYYLPVITRRVLTTLPFVLCAWPFAAQQFFLSHYDALKHFPDSWRARMEIWDYMSYRIAERPWLGWGLGTAHTLPINPPHAAQYIFTTTQAGHPHNVVTELWVELGIPGLLLGLALALISLRKCFALAPHIRPFAVGAWMAALCLSLVAYDFWTDSLFGAFALVGFAFSLAQVKQNKVAV